MIYRVVTVIGFAAVILALFVLEYLGRRKDSSIPTLGELLGYAMRPRAGRLLMLLGWLWLGWHFFSR
jgi:ABC-type dipeptide/oligopeptide/nickel transport system permease subunit